MSACLGKKWGRPAREEGAENPLIVCKLVWWGFDIVKEHNLHPSVSWPTSPSHQLHCHDPRLLTGRVTMSMTCLYCRCKLLYNASKQSRKPYTRGLFCQVMGVGTGGSPRGLSPPPIIQLWGSSLPNNATAGDPPKKKVGRSNWTK